MTPLEVDGIKEPLSLSIDWFLLRMVLCDALFSQFRRIENQAGANDIREI